MAKAMMSMTKAMAGSAGVVDVIELLHDDVGYDLGVILGAVAGNVDDTAVFAKAPGKGQAKTGQESRSQLGR